MTANKTDISGPGVPQSLVVVLATMLGVLGPGLAFGQQTPSLADVARKEAERRKTVSTPGKVYTNADVKRIAPPPPAAAAPGPAASPADAGGVTTKGSDLTAPAGARESGAESARPAPAAKAAAPRDERDEAWYRKEITTMRETLARQELAVEAFQSRVNALWADFTARDDPAQRAVIEKNRQEALVELDRLKREVVKLTEAIAAFEEEARRAGVPPGWLR